MSEVNEPTDHEAPDQQEYEVDEQSLQQYIDQVRGEQSMLTGLLGGLAGAALGAAGWALITVTTEREYGLVAIGVGLLAGFGVRIAGKGMETRFGVMGAILAIAGCLVGKLLAIAIIVANAEQVPIAEMILAMVTNPAFFVEAITVTFEPMDLLFYGIAIYEGYRFSFRKITQEELARFVKPSQQPVLPPDGQDLKT